VNKEYFKDYYEKHRERKLLYALEYAVKNREKKREYDKQRRLLKGDILREYDRERASDPSRLATKRNWSRKRKMSLKQATPNWLTPEQKDQIKDLYIKAVCLSKDTGILHEVDHIIPLHGKRVCGLHVPSNLQILTKEDNFKKLNHFE
jgi:5-methylcytosine-specific restriction endonuclease McrA